MSDELEDAMMHAHKRKKQRGYMGGSMLEAGSGWSPEEWSEDQPWWFWPLVGASAALPFKGAIARGVSRLAGKGKK